MMKFLATSSIANMLKDITMVISHAARSLVMNCPLKYSTNGILRSDNILIEGGVVSIKALGTYDIPRDDLDFKVQVRLLKDENILSTLVHGVTWPFTKLLLEFTVTGSSAAPKWHYISVLDRVF